MRDGSCETNENHCEFVAYPKCFAKRSLCVCVCVAAYNALVGWPACHCLLVCVPAGS